MKFRLQRSKAPEQDEKDISISLHKQISILKILPLSRFESLIIIASRLKKKKKIIEIFQILIFHFYQRICRCAKKHRKNRDHSQGKWKSRENEFNYSGLGLILGTKLSIKFCLSKIYLCRGHSISPCLLGECEGASGKSSVVSMVEYDLQRPPPLSLSPFLSFSLLLFHGHTRFVHTLAHLAPTIVSFPHHNHHHHRHRHLATTRYNNDEITRTRRRLLH